MIGNDTHWFDYKLDQQRDEEKQVFSYANDKDEILAYAVVSIY